MLKMSMRAWSTGKLQAALLQCRKHYCNGREQHIRAFPPIEVALNRHIAKPIYLGEVSLWDFGSSF